MLKWMDNNLDKLLVDLSVRAPVKPAGAPAAKPAEKPVETAAGKPLEVLAIQCRQTILIVQQASPVKSCSTSEAPAKASNSTDDLNRITSSTVAGEEAAAAEDSQEVSICPPLGCRNNRLSSCCGQGFWYVRGEDSESLLEGRASRNALENRPNTRRGTEALGRQMRIGGIGIVQPVTLRVQVAASV